MLCALAVDTLRTMDLQQRERLAFFAVCGQSFALWPLFSLPRLVWDACRTCQSHRAPAHGSPGDCMDEVLRLACLSVGLGIDDNRELPTDSIHLMPVVKRHWGYVADHASDAQTGAMPSAYYVAIMNAA
jgi:hypothetical protein